jgi:hypothetical protein
MEGNFPSSNRSMNMSNASDPTHSSIAFLARGMFTVVRFPSSNAKEMRKA